jgi:hypothetical protein
VERVDDPERLVAALRARGVAYLAPSDAAGAPLDDDSLLASLAASPAARLRQALAALFLVQPGLAEHVPAVRAALDPAAQVELTAQYMAAVYLREMWATRLSRYLPQLALLPDLFSQALGLPAPSEGYGKTGLHRLAAWHQGQTNRPGDRLTEYYNVADLLFGQLRLRANSRVAAVAGRAN